MSNLLYYGDNLEILRRHIEDESVDLIYLDPPFNSNASYNVLFDEATGDQSAAQIRAFEDTWHWGLESEEAFQELVTTGPPRIADLLVALRTFLGSSDMMAYLAMMAPRLLELHRVLKRTGTIYLHCDPTASHYLKLIMDGIFGPATFRNEVIWKRTSAHSSARRYGPVHDVLLFYTKSDTYTWNQTYQPYDRDYVETFFDQTDPDGRRWKRSDLTGAGVRHGESGKPWRGIDVSAKGRHWMHPPSVLDKLDAKGRIHWPKKEGGMPRLRQYPEDLPGVPLQDVWVDIRAMHNLSKERLGYPTQKPESLLERIISASSNKGDVVLDPFCGCGTAVAAAERLGRRWIGIDITHLAIALIRRRLVETFGPERSDYRVIGEPTDLAGANALAVQDRFQFQWWVLGLLGARLAESDKRKGKDRGIDGVLYFFDDHSGQAKKVVLQVKSGHVSARDVRDLVGVVDRERAAIGSLITLRPPTRDMSTEAASAGFYDWAPMHGQPIRFPRIQILSVADLLDGRRLDMPPRMEITYKQAERRRKAASEQLRFDQLRARA